MHILLFYKFAVIENPQKFRDWLLGVCEDIELKGRILVAEEGLNGSVSGNAVQVEKFKGALRGDERFSDILFKEDVGVSHPFKKMMVKVKKVVLNMGEEINIENTGKYLSPKEFLEIYDENDENLIILDTRNEYESRVGKFKNAITPNIDSFREFPKFVEELADKKDKKIVMYCTGGIRCEKASAYMKEQGFKDVSQLHGGILTFGKEFPDTVWEGTCFVFDKRMTSAINKEETPVGNCWLCEVSCDLYKDCANDLCNDFCVVCVNCEQEYGGCCSKDCFADKMKQKMNN